MAVGRTYSFFRRIGRVGTNFIFWAPALVVSAGIFARLAMAFPVFDGPGVPDIWVTVRAMSRSFSAVQQAISEISRFVISVINTKTN
jgi:hypothetical protein